MTAVDHSLQTDDLRREVYGILGIPIDVIDMATTLRKIEAAAARRTPFLISTANLNFVVMSQSDDEFKASLFFSDLCTADGMPIVWVARLLGIQIEERIAGADIFERLKSSQSARSLNVFLFGGLEGAAATACKKLNDENVGMKCAGSYYPGFRSVNEMSTDGILETINSSGADFLAAALGAKKGQAWLLHNHTRLRVPVRAHLGATINFQAGTLSRAPKLIRKYGLEWLWRIKEEPQLWQRYWNDGIVLLRIMLTQVLPLMILSRWHQLKWDRREDSLKIARTESDASIIFTIDGAATTPNVNDAIRCFHEALAAAKNVVISFARTTVIDARFIGLLVMINKRLTSQHLSLKITDVPPRVGRIIRLSGFGFLLDF